MKNPIACICGNHPLVFTKYAQDSNAAAIGFPHRWICDVTCCDHHGIGYSSEFIEDSIEAAIFKWNKLIETL